jgi:lysophospholipase L1-like esterase
LIKDVDLPDLSAQLTTALTPSLGAATAAAFGQIFGQARQATSNDFVLLTTKPVIGTAPLGAPASINKYGISYPLENQHVLSQIETNKVLTATAAYNAGLQSLASSKGLAFVNANAKMTELSSSSGLTFNGVKFTTEFVTGGSFSLDGVHLTGKGYAIIANEFIKSINQKYQSTLPQVNIYNYSGVTFP